VVRCSSCAPVQVTLDLVKAEVLVPATYQCVGPGIDKGVGAEVEGERVAPPRLHEHQAAPLGDATYPIFTYIDARIGVYWRMYWNNPVASSPGSGPVVSRLEAYIFQSFRTSGITPETAKWTGRRATVTVAAENRSGSWVDSCLAAGDSCACGGRFPM
jgi:hypothetical protein